MWESFLENNGGRIIKDKRGNENKRCFCLRVCYSLYISFPSAPFFFFLSDWEEEQVSSPNILRLIYQGRFLHGNVTLGGEKTPGVKKKKKKKVRLPCLIVMHAKSQRCVAGKFFAVLIPFFPEPQNRGTSVLRTSLGFEGEREGGERKC